MPELSPEILRYVPPPPGGIATAQFSPHERELLDQINERIGAHQSLSDVIDFLAGATREISPCDRYSVAFVEEDGRRLVAHYTRASYEPLRLRPGYAEDLAGSSLEAVLNRGTPRLINDLERYLAARPQSRSTKVLIAEGVRSSMTCPLRVDDRIVGVLFRSARQPNAFDDHQVMLHLATADRLSQVVEKTWRIEQLDAANRAYFEMLGFVTHELKSPVASMLTEAGLLRDGYLGELNDEQRKHVDKITSRGDYLLKLIGDYLELSRLESGQFELNTRPDVDLVADVLEPALDIVAAQFNAQNMRISRAMPEKRPPVEVDPQQLKIVMINLLSNAAKYGRPDGEVRISATLADGHLRISVWNEGPGFPPEQRNRLFRKFSRLQTPELLKRKGTGVGLYTSWRIVSRHGGRMDARSEPGQWAEFSLEIPQPLQHSASADS